MSGFFRTPKFWAAAAAALALAGAAGWGLAAGPDEPAVVLVDASPSCAASAIEGARTFDHGDLLRAVREAGGQRVVLHTDGCDTTGKKPVDPGFPVDVVPAPRRDHARLLALVAPDRCGVGDRVGIRVTVGRTAGPEAPPRAVRVALSRDGRRIGRERVVELERGARRTLTFVDSVGEPGIVRYEARIEGGPGGRSAFLLVGGAPLVGVVGDPPEWEGFTFERARPGRPYDAWLVRGDVRDPALRSALEAAVRGGAGLLAQGAADAPLLPLTEHPPEGRAVVVLLDVSGSMDPHLAALRQGFFELCASLDPADRVALVRFRGGVVDTEGWRDAGAAAALWTTPVARGSTRIGPAITRAAELLAAAKARHRRLYVVSDGEWKDRGEIDGLPDVHRAALFVTDHPPPESRALFPLHARGADALAAALVELEKAAPDRFVRDEVEARRVDVPGWLRGALPDRGPYRDFPRLYPKGIDERIALAAGDVPLVAAREEGGRIVQSVVAAPALLRACLAANDVRLRAWREGRALHLEAEGGGGADFEVPAHGRAPARARARGLYGATLDPAPPGPLVVSYAGARAAVPALEDAERAGLFPDEAWARELARVSGGSWGAAEASNPRRGRAVHATLLAAALLVLAAAWFRRR